jgi:hypothetical protein
MFVQFRYPRTEGFVLCGLVSAQAVLSENFKTVIDLLAISLFRENNFTSTL